MKINEPEKDRDHAENHSNGATGRGRAKEIVASLRGDEGAGADVFDAFWQLDRLPIDDVREALTPWTGPLPDLDRLDTATRLAHGLPPRPLKLRTLSVATDADILDLGPVAEEQLRLAGKSWDGTDRAPEDRLDGELEGSFAGTLERRVLADAEAPGDTPLFDVFLFAEDSGIVFAAGTTNVVALIAYKKVETRDRRIRAAIEEAVAGPRAQHLTDSTEDAPPPSPVAITAPEPEETVLIAPPEKRRAVAKKAAKKTAVKKTVAKKAAAKKTVVKKAAAKKTAKKTAAKKTATKKTAAKKTAKKTVPAKKTTAKKTAARKTAKKAAAKKTAAKKKTTSTKRSTR